MVSVREVLGLNLFIGRKIKMTFFHNQALKNIFELSLFVGRGRAQKKLFSQSGIKEYTWTEPVCWLGGCRR